MLLPPHSQTRTNRTLDVLHRQSHSHSLNSRQSEGCTVRKQSVSGHLWMRARKTDKHIQHHNPSLQRHLWAPHPKQNCIPQRRTMLSQPLVFSMYIKQLGLRLTPSPCACTYCLNSRSIWRLTRRAELRTREHFGRLAHFGDRYWRSPWRSQSRRLNFVRGVRGQARFAKQRIQLEGRLRAFTRQMSHCRVRGAIFSCA